MPKVSEIFGGSYLKAEHLNGQPRVFTINGWNTEIVYGKDAYVVYLVEDKRALKLNNILAHDIATALKIDDMEDWPGGKIELYPSEQKITDRDTQAEKQVTMIRARAPSGSASKALGPSGSTPPRRSDPDDEIAF